MLPVWFITAPAPAERDTPDMLNPEAAEIDPVMFRVPTKLLAMVREAKLAAV
jgi:hypothetical protein